MPGLHHSPISVLGAFLCVGLFACQQEPNISAELDDYADHGGSVLALSCLCFEELNFMSTNECYEALGDIDEPEIACLADVAEGYESEAQSYLDCVIPALEDYETCLLANENCVEGVYDMCAGTYTTAEAECPALPEAIRGPFDACTGL